MNCCDEYGDCRQGRDCPIRKHRAIEYNTGWNKLDAALSAIAYCVTIVGAICLALLASWSIWYLFRS